jgi:predicted DNA-binding transcriptional regulator AlpA
MFSDFRTGSQTMATATPTPPELMTKKQVAEFLQCSQRQVELLTNKGRLPKPVYLGESSPRWRRAELLASLGTVQEGGEV